MARNISACRETALRRRRTQSRPSRWVVKARTRTGDGGQAQRLRRAALREHKGKGEQWRTEAAHKPHLLTASKSRLDTSAAALKLIPSRDWRSRQCRSNRKIARPYSTAKQPRSPPRRPASAFPGPPISTQPRRHRGRRPAANSAAASTTSSARTFQIPASSTFAQGSLSKQSATLPTSAAVISERRQRPRRCRGSRHRAGDRRRGHRQGDHQHRQRARHPSRDGRCWTSQSASPPARPTPRRPGARRETP